MARHETPTLALGLLAFFVGMVVLLMALSLGFYIEATPRAIADSAKGHRIAVPAVVALVAGVVALSRRRRRWATRRRLRGRRCGGRGRTAHGPDPRRLSRPGDAPGDSSQSSSVSSW